MHVIVRISGKLVEIQVRTSLQHLWAELSEKLSDLFDPNIKYGGGDDEPRGALAGTSANVANLERLEQSIAHLEKQYVSEQILQQVQELREQVVRANKEFADFLSEWI